MSDVVVIVVVVVVLSEFTFVVVVRYEVRKERRLSREGRTYKVSYLNIKTLTQTHTCDIFSLSFVKEIGVEILPADIGIE